ncbi:MAG: pectate lyase, partial [Planctomycetota bacterium]|jgi:PelA/Pel-15E family pectate lyase
MLHRHGRARPAGAALSTACCLLLLAGAARGGTPGLKWDSGPGNILSQKRSFYGGAEARRIAETVLLLQRECGGWPKNIDMVRKLGDRDRATLRRDRRKTDAMFDNGATYTHMAFLARVHAATGDGRLKAAFLKGLAYTLAAQYPGGGWPQSWPNPRGYARHITFNDNAMVGVLRLLDGIARGREDYSFVDRAARARAGAAVEKGVECILKCQIVVDGRPTAWCAQHDAKTFEPRPARSYELATRSGSESVGVVRFLMGIDRPSPEVARAVHSAAEWFDKAKLTGIRVDKVPGGGDRGFDRVVVPDPDAPPVWARFYEIGTDRPIFCDRDGVRKYRLAEIGYERRTGYAWYGSWPARLLERDYPEWCRTKGGAPPRRVRGREGR